LDFKRKLKNWKLSDIGFVNSLFIGIGYFERISSQRLIDDQSTSNTKLNLPVVPGKRTTAQFFAYGKFVQQ
jgi:hypothetical protein